MCGRYAASRSPDDLVEEFEVDMVDRTDGLEADYNVAPTKPVPAIVTRPPRGKRDESPVRQLTVLQWGLVPSWAKDPKIGNRMINARTETVAEKPAFRRAFARRRCLLPADGYYEWYETDQRTAKGRPVKQPFFIRPRDGGVLAMAGLYEIWRNGSLDRDDPNAFLWTCTVLTTTAEDEIGQLHDRMPLLVERDRWREWLDPSHDGSAAPDALLGLLVPAAPGSSGPRLEAYPVSREVNAVQNNGSQLVQPIPVAETAGTPGTGQAAREDGTARVDVDDGGQATLVDIDEVRP